MSTSDPLIGKQLGDYKIEGLIGHGGMARVYRGYDEKLDRNAAVKVIEPTLIASGEEEEYRDRFLREARSIARLNHPNIVGVYQFAQEENLYFIAMAYLDGQDLREILKANAEQNTVMERDVMIKILSDIAKGLDYAHKNSIIHRDVKPSNIIVTTEGNAVLTDFGLALNAIEGTIGNTFGSVHYIAPEQAISSAQSVAQSDQYSLAVIVYELLAGQVPFDDASAMSVALKHISDPPPPIRDLNPKVSPELEEVVMRALDKEPNNRYEHVIDFIDAFEKALNDSPDALSSEILADRPVPPVSPSMDDDAPTIPDTGSRPQGIGAAGPRTDQVKTKVPGDNNASEKNNNTTTIAVVAIVVIVALVVGGLLMANSAAQATAATETAVVVAAQNAAATDSANADNTSTAVANDNATSTEDANITNTEMAIANDNATSTEDANIANTEIAIANDNATSTEDANIANTETAIANDNATETEIANDNATGTADFNMVQTENAISTVDAQQTKTAIVEATETQLALVSPTPSATLTPSPTLTPSLTPTLTPSPTNTFTPSPSPAPTRIPLVSEEDEEQLLLRYDGRTLLLTNRSSNRPIFIDNLVFTKFIPNDDGEFVSSTSLRLSSTFSSAPSPLVYQNCLQLWDSRSFGSPSSNNNLVNGSCETAPFWRTSSRVFWADQTPDLYFEVTVNGVDFLGRCPTKQLGSIIEERCVIRIP